MQNPENWNQQQWNDLFPFADYRDKQEATMKAIVTSLHDPDISNVLVSAPTGVGKSGMGVAAARSFDTSFYTTPQKKLRRQLEQDSVLNQHYETLRGRRDYTCGVTQDNCKDCKINKNVAESCWNHDECTYTVAKNDAMSADTAVITLSYLLTDSEIPVSNESMKISFEDRDLLVVDECHGLEDQTATLHAKVELTPWTVPPDCFKRAFADIDGNSIRHHSDQNLIGKVKTLKSRIGSYIHEKQTEEDLDEMEQNWLETAKDTKEDIEWVLEGIEEYDRDYVVDIERVKHPTKNGERKSVELRPVDVGAFLKTKLWSRADKRLLMSATVPFKNSESQYLYRIGLDPDETHVIRVGMPFPDKNRPVSLSDTVADMSSGGDDENWSEIMDKLNEIAGRHSGQRGLIHSVSYSRAERIARDAAAYDNLSGNVTLHRGDRPAMERLNEWVENDDYQIMLSPSMMEGVDMVDDMCRWQALIKMPYPYYGDNRVSYLVEETGWQGRRWYQEKTANMVVQSVGRAVRHKDDWAQFYILDEKFDELRDRVDLPEWFTDSITEEYQPIEHKDDPDPLEFEL